MINLPFGLLVPMFLILGIIVFFAIHFFINDDWEELRIGFKAVTIIATILSMIFLAGNAIEAKKTIH